MRAFLLSTLIICASLVLTACWDNRDINQRVMPVSMGIEKDGDDYIVYLRIPVTGQGQNASNVIIERGKTINTIIDTIGANMESNVDLFHVKLILLEADQVKKDGLEDVISGFMRSREISSKAIIAIVDEDMNHFFEETSKKLNEEGILLLDYFGQNKGTNPHIAFTRVWEVYRSIYSDTQSIAIPIIMTGKTTVIKQLGSAIIRKGKMVGSITADETLLYNAFRGIRSKGNIEVLDHASVLLLSSSIKNRTRVEKQIPKLSTEIKLKVMILETKQGATEKQIKKELEKLLSDRFNSMLSNLQENKADILGIGQYFRKDYTNKELKNWKEEYFPKVEHHLTVAIEIQNHGHLKLPKS